jgi:hypothetical protein
MRGQMKDQNQTYLCIKAVGSAFLLQPADKDTMISVKERADNIWYYATSRPLYEFNIFKSFGSYRDMQAAFSAMTLVDPLIEGPM